ncbi:hypothetical protein B0H10DRAFT_1966168 [Mycena sp. CBHHK59/15]|nr:hypothetical protein B0H10DRAFT_1966168 [Mycena sp. CBHHK59/15]
MHAMRFGCSRRKKEVMVREMWASASSQAGAWLGAVKVEGEAAQLEVVMLPRRHESIRVEGCKHGKRRAGQVDWVELWVVGAWSPKQQCRRRKRSMATGVIGIGGGWVQSSQASKQEHEHGVGGGPTNTRAGGKNQQILEMDDDADADADASTCCPARCHWGVLSVGGGCHLLLANGAERERAPLHQMYEDTKTEQVSTRGVSKQSIKTANTALEMKPQMAQESDTAQKEWKRESMATSGWKAAQHHESQGKPSSGGRSPGAKKTAGTTQWGT